jgi:hypothetical protein
MHCYMHGTDVVKRIRRKYRMLRAEVVCRFPPGTSKWNKIEHRLFSFITRNWRNRPLVSRQAIVSLIAGATTRTGLIVKAALDTNRYDLAIKVSDEELGHVRLKPHEFHGDWNYTIAPHRRR